MRTILMAAAVALLPMVGAAQNYDKGMAAEKSGDWATALQEWRPLADQGNSNAQYNLGRIYYNGLGVPQDYAEAMRWYRLAAEQGRTNAQNKLGSMYAEGNGVPQDYAEAMRWYRLAVDQGSIVAPFRLGVIYMNGNGVPQDYVTAHMWFSIAFANGNVRSSEARDDLAAKMTPADISEAQRSAKVCMASNYQDCD